ncbi:pectate lyase family protein [Flavobacterium hydrophilum]|uniref:Pectate lyase n=1 Tax=Flavobacterium hydrophilum TaxID=2211445 RepID=A0A2V4C2Q1_9FLAO|nr:T9SS type A sorting domain-containing protein [Flavobacterium hydrophilum]PXY45092.1 pectate lyase [Flavobacterium hydrophilum]
MKRILLYMALLLVSLQLGAQTITKSSGWLESAFVEWSPAAGADSYNVYYTGGGETNKKIDEPLIRSYGTYFRADVPGLAAGSYTLTVKPVTASVEGTGTTTSVLTVLAQDRNGFAFQGGRIPGAYNLNGTLKNNAIVLYITQNTKNTISLDVITGSNGTTKTKYTGLQSILDGYKKGYDIRPLAIRLIGNISDLTYMLNGDLVIENKQNALSSITMEGIGNDAVANGWGLRIKNASNVEVRNIGFMLTDAGEGDNVGLQQDNDHIWVHNCDMFYGAAGGDADQAKGDGALDAKKSTYITFSYNHFWDSGKSNLLGLSEGTVSGLYITYHHNWYDHSDSRHPRVRYYSAHVYNNYYDGNSKYGTGSTLGSSVFMESNFFRNCKYPMLTSQQGTDKYGGAEGTFSGEAGGTIKAFNNVMSGQTRYVPYDAVSNPIEFDAIEVADKSLPISNGIKSKLGANIYNNFDIDPLIMYSYTADSPADAKTNTMTYAGRIEGGDLKWTFNNAVDDTSSDVNAALKTALADYTTKMVSVQGETVAPGNQTLVLTTGNNDQSVSSGNAIASIVFTWGGDATDASVTGLPNGIIATKNTTAKTVTLSGTPTETMDYTVATTGSIGSAASISGTITMLPASSQVITSTTNNNQTVTLGTAIAPIVLTWSGDATDADISGLALGLSSVKDAVAKTITISGTPTVAGSATFTAITTGAVGTSVAVSGTIMVNTVPVGDVIHNYTLSGMTSNFYTFEGSAKSGPAPTTYEGLSLTKAHKMDSAGKVTYTTTGVSTLTLVILSAKTSPTIKLNGTAYPIPADGVIVIQNVPAGLNTILQGNGESHLYYLKTSYATLGLGDNVLASKLAVYPNPVSDQLFISSEDKKVENVVIYSLSGFVVKNISNEVESVDVSDLASGNYIVKLTTDQGTAIKKIIKK